MNKGGTGLGLTLPPLTFALTLDRIMNGKCHERHMPAFLRLGIGQQRSRADHVHLAAAAKAHVGEAGRFSNWSAIRLPYRIAVATVASDFGICFRQTSHGLALQ